MGLTEAEKRIFMLQMSAYCFGLIVLSCLAFLFLPIARGSILLRLIDIPFEHATRYHVWLGNLIFFLVTMHGLCYMIVWSIRGIIPSEVVEWKSDGGANLTGIICHKFFLFYSHMAKSVWLLHLLAFSLGPTPSQFEATRGAEFHPHYMESVVKF